MIAVLGLKKCWREREIKNGSRRRRSRRSRRRNLFYLILLFPQTDPCACERPPAGLDRKGWNIGRWILTEIELIDGRNKRASESDSSCNDNRSSSKRRPRCAGLIRVSAEFSFVFRAVNGSSREYTAKMSPRGSNRPERCAGTVHEVRPFARVRALAWWSEARSRLRTHMNTNFHRFQNFRKYSNFAIWLKTWRTSLFFFRARHSFLEFVAKSGQNFVKN